MPIKAILFDMFDTLMLIEKNHEFYPPSMRRMHQYLNKHGIDVPFEKFNPPISVSVTGFMRRRI